VTGKQEIARRQQGQAQGSPWLQVRAASSGHAAAHELKRRGWTVRALARRAVEGPLSITADLIDAEATAAAP
jgi:hypothetical protein